MDKVFLGLHNIASQFNDLKKSFAALGVKTFTVTAETPSRIINNSGIDFNIKAAKDRIQNFRPHRISSRVKPWWDKQVEKYIFKKVKNNCDICIFFWSTFNRDLSDLRILKEAGKKIVVVFVGDDVRWYHAMKQEFNKYGFHPIEYNSYYDYSLNGLQQRLELIRNAEKYADIIFSRLDQSQLQVRPFYRWNMMVNPSDYTNNFTQAVRPIVAHAPSSRLFKGTKYVLEAFEKLKEEGVDFEPLLIENVPHLEAIKLYTNADILIDQLLCPGSGKLATEALASGTIVMSHMGYDVYPQNNPPDCPIIDVNPSNIYEKLKELILNYNFRIEHAKKSRPYVEKHLDVKFFCQKVLDLLNGADIACDYYPTFFRSTFIPESQESIPVYNRWTEHIKDCNWYKEHVVSGSRDGLIF